MKSIKSFLLKLGPGLLMAGAAIGVSHLVQSTRAGANYGYQLILVIVLANLFKYPFFEFGHRFAVATNENLLVGYQKVSRWFLWAFLGLNTITSIGTMAGVTVVTGALAYNLFGESLSVTWWSAIVLLVCNGILVFGHYKFLDLFMKFIMLILFVATIGAFVAAFAHGPVAPKNFVGESAFAMSAVPFLIALMGWMPAPIETSVWTSLWVQAKNRSENKLMSWTDAKIDFNFGYYSTMILAVIFLLLGALVMYGSGVQFSDTGGGFAAQVVNLYTQNLGEWSRPIISFAAFSTMFSTTLTCLDAYPRSLTAATELVFKGKKITGRFKSFLQPQDRRTYYFWLLWSGLGGLLVIAFLSSSLKTLIDFVTTSAFLAAPIFASMNYKLIFSDLVPRAYRPSSLMKGLCWVGLIYLYGFSLIYLFNH